MKFVLSLIALLAIVIGCFSIHANPILLWQPIEIIIIVGAAIAAFFIGNPSFLLKECAHSFKYVLKGAPYNKKDYLDLLLFLFEIFKTMKTKGILQVEPHIESPKTSDIFKKCPTLLSDHENLDFFCDTVRLLTIGVDNHYIMTDVLDQEIDLQTHEREMVGSALNNFGESLPALGIVAAVMGVIITMKSIAEPPEILGSLIAAALVGTFMGILLSYGIFSPIGGFIAKYNNAKMEYVKCIKVAIIAYMQGNAPLIVVEFVRKNMGLHLRPSFSELDKAINSSK